MQKDSQIIQGYLQYVGEVTYFSKSVISATFIIEKNGHPTDNV